MEAVREQAGEEANDALEQTAFQAGLVLNSIGAIKQIEVLFDERQRLIIESEK